MRRLLIAGALLGCVGLPLDLSARVDDARVITGESWPDRSQRDKEKRPDMTTAKTIFVGWVDISLDDWLPLGYEGKQSWSEVIDWQNQAFQRAIQSILPARQVTGAKDRSDENASSQELHVRFSDVRFDVRSYRLFLSIHFIDAKSGLELVSVPLEGYRGGHFSVANCLQGALKQVADRLKKEISRSPKG